MALDVKKIGGPYNLGQVEQWSQKDLDFLISQGACVNKVDYVHIPLDNVSGTVPFGRTDKSKADLRIGGLKVNRGKGQRKSYLE